MLAPDGIPVSQPRSIFQREVNVNGKALFGTLARAAVNGAFLKWDDLIENGVEVLDALGLERTSGEIAGLLIARSFLDAMKKLLESSKDLLPCQPQEIVLTELYNQINLSLDSADLILDSDFFEHPENLPLIQPTKTAFLQWLTETNLIVNAQEAKSISNRLPAYFVFALNEQWKNKPEEYSILLKELDNPFQTAVKRERGWWLYRAWLQKQIDEPVFLEAFGLQQIYVPLRGYYEQKSSSQESDHSSSSDSVKRIAIDLNEELKSWLKKGDKNDAIRLLAGSPGSGKSSFCKIFAAQRGKAEKQVLFIPLHRFRVSEDLVKAVGEFIQYDVFLSDNPLEIDNDNLQLLIIFDGLDELSMQGKIAQEIAQQFIEEVREKVRNFNQNKTRLQVIISGRDIVIQSNQNKFRQPHQILHLLPYLVSKNFKYQDPQNLLQPDQRDRWWRQYGEAKGKPYTQLPTELAGDNLQEITAQPLLNYLIALSYERGEIEFTRDTNLNKIYNNLLTEVYERKYEQQRNPGIDGIKRDEFITVLMEIALSCWHGDGRSTTVREIESHCENSGLKDLLQKFQNNFREDSKASIIRLLTAFYFRESGDLRESDKTFEFTHKSFGEYLTARRIVSRLKQIHDKLKSSRGNYNDDYDERQALITWATSCGATAIDEYLFRFLVDEMRLQPIDEVRNWQKTLCELIKYVLVKGTPMEGLKDRLNFQEETRQARNAEEALLAVLNACANVTEEVSDIPWPSPEAFGNWLSRLQGQRKDVNESVFMLNRLSFLNLQNCLLICRDLYRANLSRADLSEANLSGANLSVANLSVANLSGANLSVADLYWANLTGADLYWANLTGANLTGANLTGANLTEADLTEANLSRANLSRANLSRANLTGANLFGANLFGANLTGAIVKNTILDTSVPE